MVAIVADVQLGNDVRDGVTKLFEAAALIDPTATKRSTIGTMLQHPSVRPWDRSIVWAIVSAIRPVWSGEWDANAAAVLQRYDAFIRRIHELNLPEDIDKAPILDVGERGAGSQADDRATRSRMSSRSSLRRSSRSSATRSTNGNWTTRMARAKTRKHGYWKGGAMAGGRNGRRKRARWRARARRSSPRQGMTGKATFITARTTHLARSWRSTHDDMYD